MQESLALCRFFLATTLFPFHKFTGTDLLNYFAPAIFEMIGVPAGSLGLLTTGVVSARSTPTPMLPVSPNEAHVNQMMLVRSRQVRHYYTLRCCHRR